MTDHILNQFYSSPQVAASLRELEGHLLERDIGLQVSTDPAKTATPELRLAAIASFADSLGDLSVDGWFRAGSEQLSMLRDGALSSFRQWQGYLEAIDDTNEIPSLDDLLMFAAIGMVARRDHEVRDALRRQTCRRWVTDLVKALPQQPWVAQVRGTISASILLIIRQANHDDLREGNQLLQTLSMLQKTNDATWLKERVSPHRDAATLLGLYHIAQTVILTAKFLGNGSVEIGKKTVTDYAAELRRLCVRAEEFLKFARDQDFLFWLRSAVINLDALRSSSIWVQAEGISERIDKLVSELARANREQPVFSLLPSQQDAIRSSLLDQSRMAIVLQMPTSAGKTLLAEFSIAQTFDAYRGTTRVVYVVPTRALATQVRRTLTEDLRPLGIKVSVAGSAFEEDPYELKLLQTGDGVVVSTPEKLDLLLRTHSEWFSELRLVVVDEAHLLQDNERGARLELLLANLRREQPDAKLLLLTPFMQNAKQIAEWLSRERPAAISVGWRPTRVLLGMALVKGAGKKRHLEVDWQDPFNPNNAPRPLNIPTAIKSAELASNTSRVLFLAEMFKNLGTTLALFSASPADAEEAALERAAKTEPVPPGEMPAQLRVAVAIARHEFGADSRLAFCLERRVAFHHSSLSPILRYLIESQIRQKQIRFVAATSTLAQGMNFPVATILVHSVHKPYGGGNFTPAEFWNMAGRAGRVGLEENGLVLFTAKSHREHMVRYGTALSESLRSALLTILNVIRPDQPLKELYRDHPTLRPFIQYLAHAAAKSSPADAMANLEALIQQSLVNQQVSSDAQAQKLRTVARRYLQEIVTSPGQMIKAADSTGLGTFSFNELYAKLRQDPILSAGPRAVVDRGEVGIHALVEALRWLPELNLAIGFGPGPMNVDAVARAVQGWIDGRPVYELAAEFPGKDPAKRVREASHYLYSTVSQTISWGAHAFLRGWTATGNAPDQLAPEDCLLPSLIQYGVRTPEAAVASLLGVPRPLAEATGEEFRTKFGSVTPDTAARLRDFIEEATDSEWGRIVSRSQLGGVSGAEFRAVFREMQGLVS